MRLIKVAAASALMLFSPFGMADLAAEREAEALLESMQMEVALEESLSQIMDIQLQQNPALLPYKDVVMQFFRKHVSYSSLKPEMIKIYAEVFTAEELRDINAFYRTETGQKTIRLMPQLSAAGAQLGLQRIQQNGAELQRMIQAEAARIKELQAQ